MVFSPITWGPHILSWLKYRDLYLWWWEWYFWSFPSRLGPYTCFDVITISRVPWSFTPSPGNTAHSHCDPSFFNLRATYIFLWASPKLLRIYIKTPLGLPNPVWARVIYDNYSHIIHQMYWDWTTSTIQLVYNLKRCSNWRHRFTYLLNKGRIDIHMRKTTSNPTPDVWKKNMCKSTNNMNN